MAEGLPCFPCLIWRLDAKPQTGKDFVSNPVSYHRDRGGLSLEKHLIVEPGVNL